MANGGTTTSPPRRRVTVTDVAKRLGLSAATVSLGLRGSSQIKRSTRQLVQTVAKEMNYRPAASARALVGGRTHTIGLIIADPQPARSIDFVHYAEALRVIRLELVSRDYLVSLTEWFELEGHIADQADLVQQHIPRALRESGIEGLLVLRTPEGPGLELTVKSQNLPHVLMDATPGYGRITVSLDECRSSELAVEHLASLGHRRIAYLSPYSLAEANGPYANWRKNAFPRGYARAMSAAGLAPVPGWDEDNDTGMYLEKLLQDPEPPTGLITYDDSRAVWAIGLLKKRGLRVPQDVSVVALLHVGTVDPLFFETGLIPRFTCTANMQEQMAKISVQKLIQLIEKPGEAPPESELLEPRLEIGESSGPCSLPVGHGQTAVG